MTLKGFFSAINILCGGANALAQDFTGTYRRPRPKDEKQESVFFTPPYRYPDEEFTGTYICTGDPADRIEAWEREKAAMQDNDDKEDAAHDGGDEEGRSGEAGENKLDAAEAGEDEGAVATAAPGDTDSKIPTEDQFSEEDEGAGPDFGDQESDANSSDGSCGGSDSGDSADAGWEE